MLRNEYYWYPISRINPMKPAESTTVHVESDKNESSCSFKKRELGQLVGFTNVNSTCYANSVIQVLFMTDK